MAQPHVKYIFVTGGVVSSLGKGIAAASLGLLLKSRGLRVTIQKMDPYLNVDPGTMFYKHFGIYVYRADFLQHYTTLKQSPLEIAEKLEQLRILENGYKIKCAITEYESHPVDTPEDLERVRTIILRHH